MTNVRLVGQDGRPMPQQKGPTKPVCKDDECWMVFAFVAPGQMISYFFFDGVHDPETRAMQQPGLGFAVTKAFRLEKDMKDPNKNVVRCHQMVHIQNCAVIFEVVKRPTWFTADNLKNAEVVTPE